MRRRSFGTIFALLLPLNLFSSLARFVRRYFFRFLIFFLAGIRLSALSLDANLFSCWLREQTINDSHAYFVMSVAGVSCDGQIFVVIWFRWVHTKSHLFLVSVPLCASPFRAYATGWQTTHSIRIHTIGVGCMNVIAHSSGSLYFARAGISAHKIDKTTSAVASLLWYSRRSQQRVIMAISERR